MITFANKQQAQSTADGNVIGFAGFDRAITKVIEFLLEPECLTFLDNPSSTC